MQPPPVSKSEIEEKLRPGPSGFVVAPNNLRIDFGRHKAGAIASVDRLLGGAKPRLLTNTECGAGPLSFATWDDGLEMVFDNETFVGWSTSSTRFVTTTGIAVGAPVSSLDGFALTQTSLGTEFDDQGIFGVIDTSTGSETVKRLWAGTTCFFR